MNLQITDILVCDDVRYEEGNKHSLIGLLSNLNINVHKDYKEPIQIPLSVMLRLHSAERNITLKKLSVTIFTDDKNIVSKEVISKNSQLSEFTNIVLNKEVFTLSQNTILKFMILAVDENDNMHNINSDYTFAINIHRTRK